MLTVVPCRSARQFILPLGNILLLPDGPDAIELRVVKVKGRVAGRRERIVHQTPNGEVAYSMETWITQSFVEIAEGR